LSTILIRETLNMAKPEEKKVLKGRWPCNLIIGNIDIDIHVNIYCGITTLLLENHRLVSFQTLD